MDDNKNPVLNPLDPPGTNPPADPSTPTPLVPDAPPAPPPPVSGPQDTPPAPPPTPEPGPFVPPTDEPGPPQPLAEIPEEQPTDAGPPTGEAGLPPVITPLASPSTMSSGPNGSGPKAKIIASIIGLVLLVVSIPAGIILVGRQQDIREKAYSANDCTAKGGLQQQTEDCDCNRMTRGELVEVFVCKNGERLPGRPTGKTCVSGQCEPSVKTCQNSGGNYCGTDPASFCKDYLDPLPSRADRTANKSTDCGDGQCWNVSCRGEKKISSTAVADSSKKASDSDAGGCCDPGAADNSAKGCRTTGGYNEVCDIPNGACQSSFSCRSKTGCANDTDCGPVSNNACVGGTCKSLESTSCGAKYGNRAFCYNTPGGPTREEVPGSKVYTQDCRTGCSQLVELTIAAPDGDGGGPVACAKLAGAGEIIKATDGQSLATQSCDTITLFVNTYGSQAGKVWADQHNAATGGACTVSSIDVYEYPFDASVAAADRDNRFKAGDLVRFVLNISGTRAPRKIQFCENSACEELSADERARRSMPSSSQPAAIYKDIRLGNIGSVTIKARCTF